MAKQKGLFDWQFRLDKLAEADDRMPDANTIWIFENAMAGAELQRELRPSSATTQLPRRKRSHQKRRGARGLDA